MRAGLIGILLVVNAAFLFQHTLWSLRIFRLAFPLTNSERRRLIMPLTSRTLNMIEDKVPPRAVLWLVSPIEARDWVYFLYPRLIGKGSPRIEDREKVRARHPGDWVITSHSEDPAQDYLDLWPPLKDASARPKTP